MTQKTDSPSAICEICGKKKVGGSITQWIFNVDSCSCLTPQKQTVVLKLCPLCGCRQKASSGSITQWIFQSAECKCDAHHEPLEEVQLPDDDIIDGSPYEFIGVAGTGGVGAVYKAKSKKLAKEVAIKAINPLLDEAFDTHNFHREAKSISKLQHPNILSIIDFGSMTDGRPYLVTEWIEGCTLAQYIQRYGVLSFRAAEEVFLAVLDGLSHAHNRHIIHRDIKPGNIMLSRTNAGWTVKIIDFGTSKDTANDQSRTRIEDLAFSPFYVSPERISGSVVDQRADLYSLGCTMFEALTGRPPFTGKAMMVALRHQNEAPPALLDASQGTEFPKYLEQVVAKLLAKEPGKRFQNADEVKAAIRSRQVKEDRAPSHRMWLTPVIVWASTACLFGAFMYFVFFEPAIDAQRAVSETTQKKPATSLPDSEFGPDMDAEWIGLPWEGIMWLSQTDGTSALDKIPDTTYYSFLNLRSHVLTADELRRLCTHKNLRGLSIPDTGLTPELLGIVSTAPSLEALYIGQNPKLDDSALKPLTEAKHLSILSLAEGKFTDKSFDTISQLNSLSFLKLDESKYITGSRLGMLRGIRGLEKLSLKNTKLSAAGWKELGSLRQLKVLHVGGTGLTDQTMRQLSHLKLERLDISNTAVTDQGLKALLQMKTLRFLYARECKLSPQAIENLKDAIGCEIITEGEDNSKVRGDAIFNP